MCFVYYCVCWLFFLCFAFFTLFHSILRTFLIFVVVFIFLNNSWYGESVSIAFDGIKVVFPFVTVCLQFCCYCQFFSLSKFHIICTGILKSQKNTHKNRMFSWILCVHSWSQLESGKKEFEVGQLWVQSLQYTLEYDAMCVCVCLFICIIIEWVINKSYMFRCSLFSMVDMCCCCFFCYRKSNVVAFVASYKSSHKSIQGKNTQKPFADAVFVCTLYRIDVFHCLYQFYAQFTMNGFTCILVVCLVFFAVFAAFVVVYWISNGFLCDDVMWKSIAI